MRAVCAARISLSNHQEVMMAESTLSEAGKKALAEGKEARERSMAEYAERMKGKPTPTQDENDRGAVGESILEHEADGSTEEKHLEARPGAGYQTRQATAAPPRRPPGTA
jgi:hypothetical protein